MQELRWNPLLGTWVMVSANRQNRPHLPKDWCPFCPDSGRVPKEYEVLFYDNDYPVLSNKVAPLDPTKSVYGSKEAYGKCEVILYSSNHNTCMSELSVGRIQKVVEMWITRNKVLEKDVNVNFIFPFENRGKEVGVTMPHPHGQLYAYPFIPLKLKTELENAKNHFVATGNNLFDEMNVQEAKSGRLIFENESFLAYLPHFTDYPYGIFIVAKSNRLFNLSEFQSSDTKCLAEVLKKSTVALDKVLDRPMPYMMCVHQTPVNDMDYKNAAEYFRFHIEFYPVLRSKDKIKWYASSEMGAWAAANPMNVDFCAQELRTALQIFENNGNF